MSRIFSLFLAIFLVTASLGYAAGQDIYVVENVITSIAGKSPTDARNQAIASARRDAFLILLTRLELNTKMADTVNNQEIAEMVRSEQIEGEKISGNTYSGNFNITFAKDFVDHILAQKNLPRSEAKKEGTYLLIPAKIVKQKIILWEENNDWKKAITKNINGNKKNKFIVPEADMADISLINRDNILNSDYSTLEPIINKYKAEAAYILIFSFDEIENKVNINISYIRKLQKKQIKLSFVNADHLDYSSLMEKVSNKTIDYLINAQVIEKTSPSLGLVYIEIPISNFENWFLIKNRIEKSNLVSQFNIESISKDYAVITIKYVDNDKTIIEAFGEIGLQLNQAREGHYILSN